MKKKITALVTALLAAFMALSMSGCSNLLYVSCYVESDHGYFLVGEEFTPGNVTATLTDWLGKEVVYDESDMTFDSSDFDSSRLGAYEISVVINSIGYEFSYEVFVVSSYPSY